MNTLADTGVHGNCLYTSYFTFSLCRMKIHFVWQAAIFVTFGPLNQKMQSFTSKVNCENVSPRY